MRYGICMLENEPTFQPEPAALSAIPPRMAQNYHVLPLRLADNVLTIAATKEGGKMAAKVQNFGGFTDVRVVTECSVDEIRELLSVHYPNTPDLLTDLPPEDPGEYGD